ncbi:MAG TPA: hypothetical protein VHL57_03890 [Flavobacteriales bacterium]|nr:hypothetical protein [Flavobacteriales bacterium]
MPAAPIEVNDYVQLHQLWLTLVEKGWLGDLKAEKYGPDGVYYYLRMLKGGTDGNLVHIQIGGIPPGDPVRMAPARLIERDNGDRFLVYTADDWEEVQALLSPPS